jgi:hypothetical protein
VAKSGSGRSWATGMATMNSTTKRARMTRCYQVETADDFARCCSVVTAWLGSPRWKSGVEFSQLSPRPA